MNVQDPQQPQELLRVCRIGKAQGLKGEVSVELYTDEPDVRFAPGEVLYAKETGDALREFVVASSRTFKHRWYVRFEGITDRNASEALRGTILYGEPMDLDDDEFYPKDLIGLKAMDAQGNEIGTVVDMLEGAQWLVKLRLTHPTDAESTCLIPFVEPIIPDIDLEAGTMLVTPPGGLIPGYGA